jgi:hypothetical protein
MTSRSSYIVTTSASNELGNGASARQHPFLSHTGFEGVMLRRAVPMLAPGRSHFTPCNPGQNDLDPLQLKSDIRLNLISPDLSRALVISSDLSQPAESKRRNAVSEEISKYRVLMGRITARCRFAFEKSRRGESPPYVRRIRGRLT